MADIELEQVDFSIGEPNEPTGTKLALNPEDEHTTKAIRDRERKFETDQSHSTHLRPDL
jgi:hypothetical protein